MLADLVPTRGRDTRYDYRMLIPEAPRKVIKPPTARQIANKVAAEERKVRKLHTIAVRRAKQEGMEKAEFIAAIVKGQFRPITAEDIAAEPDPELVAAT
jgi:hypothetical protein